MVSIIEKATNKVVVSSISTSKLEEYGHHRMFILKVKKVNASMTL